jgi:hypothetical protein
MNKKCADRNSLEWKKLITDRLFQDFSKKAGKTVDELAELAFIRNGHVMPDRNKALEILDFPEMHDVLSKAWSDTPEHTRANLDKALSDRKIKAEGTNEQKAAAIAIHDLEAAQKTLDEKIPPEARNDITAAASKQDQANTKGIDAIVKGKDASPSAKKVIDANNQAEKQIAEKERMSWPKAKKWIIKNILYVEGRVAYMDKEYANQILAKSFRKAKMVFDMARGSGAIAARVVEQLQSDVYSKVPRKWKPVLDRLIEAKRSVLLHERMADGKIKSSPYFKDEGMSLNNNLLADDYRAMIEHIKKQSGPEMFKRLDEASNMISDTFRTYIQKLKDAGIISEGLAKYLDEVHTFYSPREIIRMIDAESPIRDGDGNPMSTESGIEAIKKGTELYLDHDWEYLAMNYIGRTEARIAKNMANRALAEHIGDIFKNVGPDGKIDNPVNFSIEKPLTDKDGNFIYEKNNYTYSEKPPEGMTRVPFAENGLTKNILMPSDVAADWVLFDPALKRSMAKTLGMLSGANFVKTMATGINFEFGIFNPIRDLQLYTFTTDVYSKWVPVAWAQMIGDMASLRPGSEAYHKMEADFIREGGGLEFLADQGRDSAVMKYLKNNDTLRGVADMLVKFNRVSETWTRLALMKRAIAPVNKGGGGMSVAEGANLARKVCDFATGGVLTKTIDKVVPYFNPGVVVTRNIGEYFMKNKSMAMFKAAQYLALGIGLAYWNKMMNKDGWESISDREKETMWLFTLPIKYKDDAGIERHMYLRLPKDQSFRAFTTIGQQIAEVSTGGKADMDSIKSSIDDAIPIESQRFVPPTVKAFLSYAYNQDFYNKIPIWNGRKVSPENEWTMQTPSLAVLWGKTSGMSPERTEGALANIFPMNPYTWMIGTIGNAVLPDDRSIHKSFGDYMMGLPGARKIVRMSQPIDLTEMQKDRAKALGVPMVNPDGTPRPPRIVRDETKDAETQRGDLRQNMDNELDRYILEAKMEGTRKSLDEFLFNIPDPKERTRLNIRLKEKARDVWMLK